MALTSAPKLRLTPCQGPQCSEALGPGKDFHIISYLGKSQGKEAAASARFCSPLCLALATSDPDFLTNLLPPL